MCNLLNALHIQRTIAVQRAYLKAHGHFLVCQDNEGSTSASSAASVPPGLLDPRLLALFFPMPFLQESVYKCQALRQLQCKMKVTLIYLEEPEMTYIVVTIAA